MENASQRGYFEIKQVLVNGLWSGKSMFMKVSLIILLMWFFLFDMADHVFHLFPEYFHFFI